MSMSADAFRPSFPADGGAKGHNKRRHPRYAISLPGRFMRADKLDYPCRLIDISVESAAMTTPVPLQVGENLIVYLTSLGGLEGTVVRLFSGSFAMTISGTQRKRDKLAVQIPRLAAQSEIPEGRGARLPARHRRRARSARPAGRHHAGVSAARSLHLRRLGRHADASRTRRRGHARQAPRHRRAPPRARHRRRIL